MLDLRTYRSQQVAPSAGRSPDPEISDPARTITGDEPDGLAQGAARDQTRAVEAGRQPGDDRAGASSRRCPPRCSRTSQDVAGLCPSDGLPYNVDQWDGYTADRHELFEHLRDHGMQNAVFLTGDIHSSWACDLPVDAGTYPASETVGTEFVCTSVTSNNLKDITGRPARTTSLAVEAGITTANRHIKYLNFDDHGYSVVDITRERMQMDYFIISDRSDRKARPRTRTASWATRVNSQKVHAVSRASRLMRIPGPDPSHRAHGRPGRPVPRGCSPRRSAHRPPPRREARGSTCSSSTAASPVRSRPTLTPRLRRAARQRTQLPAARSMPVMETIPNHVMMMTGVRPDRTGVPANSIFDRTAGRGPDLDRGRPALPDRHRTAQQAGLPTGTVLSKDLPLRRLRRPRHAPLGAVAVIPVTGHAPDQFTMDAAIAMVEEFDPHLVFVNLGDVDRFGHSDLYRHDVRAARTSRWPTPTSRSAGSSTCSSLGSVAATRWSSCSPTTRWTGPPARTTSTSLGLRGRPVAGRQGAGRRQRRRRPPLLDRPVVRPLGRRAPDAPARARHRWRPVGRTRPPSLRLGAAAGDLVVYCQAGRRFSAPAVRRNPIPGNHGHPATEPIPFFVGGGSPRAAAYLLVLGGAHDGRRPDGRRGVRARRPTRRVRRPQRPLSHADSRRRMTGVAVTPCTSTDNAIVNVTVAQSCSRPGKSAWPAA